MTTFEERETRNEATGLKWLAGNNNCELCEAANGVLYMRDSCGKAVWLSEKAKELVLQDKPAKEIFAGLNYVEVLDEETNKWFPLLQSAGNVKVKKTFTL